MANRVLPSREGNYTLEEADAILAAYVSRRLVDREAIDYEPIARKMYERSTGQFPPDWDEADQPFWFNEARLAVDAALGEKT